MTCFFGIIPKAHAQSPPLRQCIGGKAQFAVGGDEASTFRFEVTGGGRILDSINRDSIVVQWGMRPGLHRIGVQEISLGDCEGEWIYMDVDLVGNVFKLEDREIREGEVIEVQYFDPKLFKIVRWLDDEVEASRQITKPGTYEVFVQDMHGCTHIDRVRVIQQNSP
jgi:hypothetical protein